VTIERRNHGRGHSYWDGDQKIPSVTTILGAGLPKPALVEWAARMSAEYVVDHWDDLEGMAPSARHKAVLAARWESSRAAMARGTAIHEAAEALHRDQEFVPPENIDGPVRAYAAFLTDWDVRPVHVEATVINRRHRYAGTLDLIADIGSHRNRWLLDIKTGSGVFGDVALQLAAYRYAEAILLNDTEIEMHPVDHVGVIHVTPDACELVPVIAGPEQFRQFLYVAQVAAFTEHSSELIGAPLRPDQPQLRAVPDE
jgi:hypothetical protein